MYKTLYTHPSLPTWYAIPGATDKTTAANRRAWLRAHGYRAEYRPADMVASETEERDVL